MAEYDIAALEEAALAGDDREPETKGEIVRADLILRKERRNMMLSLRRRGLTHAEIAHAMSNNSRDPGYSITETGVRAVITRYLNQLANEDAEHLEHLRALENERLDAILAAHMPAATGGRNPDGTPKTPDPKAAGVCLQIMARRAKLNGLDAPKKVDHRHTGSLLHELGTDPAELAREREAFDTAYGDQGVADLELPAGDVQEVR